MIRELFQSGALERMNRDKSGASECNDEVFIFWTVALALLYVAAQVIRGVLVGFHA